MRSFDLASLSAPSSVIGLGAMIFHPDTQNRDHGPLDAFVDAGAPASILPAATLAH